MRPLTWKSNGAEYLNERVTATQQTGWVMAAQSRDWLPNHIGGIIWFATDDAANTVFAPFYCSITRVPEEYAEGNGSLTRWSDNSSFWVNNMISNFAYTRYNLIHPEIERVQQAQEKDFITKTANIDAAAQKLSDQKSAVDYLTKTCCDLGSDLVKQRKVLFQNLFMKYMDGNVKTTDDDFRFKTDPDTPDIPALTQPGYGQDWQDDVAKKTGDKLKIKN